MKRSSKLEKIAFALSKSKWLKPIGQPIWRKLYVEPLEKYRRKQFHKHGLQLLAQFDRVMKQINVSYSLVFGTLLGAVRESAFIKHDLDIDVAVWGDSDYEIIQNALIDSGFKLYRRIEVDDSKFGREETYIYNGVSIDLFYFYCYDDSYKYTTVFVPFDATLSFDESYEKFGGMLPLQLILPLERTVQYIPFMGLKVPIPTNAEQFLEARYGKNWRIPDPTFVYPKMGDAKFAYRNDKKGIVTYEDKLLKL